MTTEQASARKSVARVLAILVEEFGELAKEIIELGALLKSSPKDYDARRVIVKKIRREAVQTAAVAMQIVQFIDLTNHEAIPADETDERIKEVLYDNMCDLSVAAFRSLLGDSNSETLHAELPYESEAVSQELQNIVAYAVGAAIHKAAGGSLTWETVVKALGAQYDVSMFPNPESYVKSQEDIQHVGVEQFISIVKDKAARAQEAKLSKENGQPASEEWSQPYVKAINNDETGQPVIFGNTFDAFEALDKINKSLSPAGSVVRQAEEPKIVQQLVYDLNYAPPRITDDTRKLCRAIQWYDYLCAVQPDSPAIEELDSVITTVRNTVARRHRGDAAEKQAENKSEYWMRTCKAKMGGSLGCVEGYVIVRTEDDTTSIDKNLFFDRSNGSWLEHIEPTSFFDTLADAETAILYIQRKADRVKTDKTKQADANDANQPAPAVS